MATRRRINEESESRRTRRQGEKVGMLADSSAGFNTLH